MSLYNDIRRNIKQEQLSIEDKKKFRQFLKNTKPDNIGKFLASLIYVFTYLQNSINKPSTITIKNFVQHIIHNRAHLHP